MKFVGNSKENLIPLDERTKEEQRNTPQIRSREQQRKNKGKSLSKAVLLAVRLDVEREV